MKTNFLSTAVLCAALTGCTGGGGGGSGTSNPAEGVYAGAITDENGTPIAGARVSIDGIEANSVSSAKGSFLVSDPDLSTDALEADFGPGIAGANLVEVSVLAPGFEPHVGFLSVGPGDRANIQLLENSLQPDLSVVTPAEEQIFVVQDSCDAATVPMEGYARLGLDNNLRLDVVVVIDRSGSTGNLSFDVDGDQSVDTVLDAEIAAARCFLQTLDYGITRVCLMTFNDSAEVAVDFTDDLDLLENGLDSLNAPAGGTNFDAAFQRCEQAFLDLEEDDDAEHVPAEVDDVEISTPKRAVVFLSDGITTAHGVPRDTTDSNLTQSTADRSAAIDAAKSLGVSTNAELFAYSFIAQNDNNRKRTTLPHCVASCGGGKYKDLTDVSQLSDSLCGEPLNSVLRVEIANLTTGDETVHAEIYADGFFSEQIPVALGPVELVGPVDGDSTVANTLQVTLRAFSGVLELTETKTLSVRLMAQGDYDLLTDNELVNAQAASQPVSELENLSKPTGGAITNDDLYSLLVGDAEAEFEDAIELGGVGTFTATDPILPAVTVTVEVAFKDACYNSDVGYIVVDPENPPVSAVAALKNIPLTQSLFNTGDIGVGCGGTSIPAGTASFQFTVDAGSTVAFFLIPNRTLAQFQAQPRGQLKPIFTLPRLNQAHFDQTLEFRSLAGRTVAGPSTAVVSAGPLLLFAFEDIAIARNRSDQDFNDFVLTVRTDGSGPLQSTECDE